MHSVSRQRRLENSSLFFLFSSRGRHTRYVGDWSSDVCSSDLAPAWLTMGMLVAAAIDPAAVITLQTFRPVLALRSRRVATALAVSSAAMAMLAPGANLPAALATADPPPRSAALAAVAATCAARGATCRTAARATCLEAPRTAALAAAREAARAVASETAGDAARSAVVAALRAIR